MKSSGFLAAALLVLGFQGLTRAQTLPPNQLLAGVVAGAVGATGFGGSCYVNRGNAFFQRNGLEPKAIISFDDIADAGIWDLHGPAIMTFATPASGFIRFKQTGAAPFSVARPRFNNYSQAYDSAAKRLVVAFRIVFPDCTLPVRAVFDAT
ncbi:MAG TPA: hypothetical protein VFG05_04480 [Methylocella sp.]|nr:hypothetical protein [Methylocella sp.]